MSETNSQLQEFIQKARAHQLSDDQIRTRLVEAGWSEADVRVALTGDDLSVPLPPAGHHAQHAGSHPAHHKGDERPTITALQAALQHVLLWLFTITSTIMISIVSFILFGDNSGGSSDALLTYVVLETVTFVPFAFFYWQYIRQLRHAPDLMTGKVWSIITIVLHSLGLILSLIGFLLIIVLMDSGDSKTPGLVTFGLIALLNGLVAGAYVWANFAKAPQSIYRIWYLRLFPAALFVLIAVLGVLALVRVGPLRADDQARQDVITTANKVYEYTNDHNRLPASLGELNDAPRNVEYEPLTASTYKVCAELRKDYGSDTADAYSRYAYDNYVSDYDVSGGHEGRNCWTFNSYKLSATDGSLYR